MGLGQDRLVRIGAIATGVWLLIVLVSSVFGYEDGGRSLAQRLVALAGVLMPVALIWLAVWIARALDELRAEAAHLRAQLDLTRAGADAGVPAMPHSVALSQGAAAAPSVRQAVSAPVQAAARGGAGSPAAPRPAPASVKSPDSRQASLGLDTPPTPDLDPYELVAALNFPDGPDDRVAIAALRKALAHPELARLIRAAQDVVTLLAGQGVYMDDMRAETLHPALWRRFARGARGAEVIDLSLDADAASLQTAAAMLRWDEVFRDVAHHFLRHFDRVMTRAAEEYDDQALAALSDTRSGRAFTLLAQVTGMVGSPVVVEAQGA